MKQLSILLLFVTIGLVSFGQVYQEMPQYGYRANRMAFDSTLQIPTFCGVPTLRSVVKANKNGAIAFDSCNNKLYQYNPKTLAWAEISGGGGPSIDTTNQFVKRLTRTEGKDSIIYFVGANRFAIKDSIGVAGTGSQYFVPKWSNSTTLQNSQIFDSVNVGIGTTNPAFKLDVNGNARIGNLEINTSANAVITGQGIKITGTDKTFQFQGSASGGIESMFKFGAYPSDDQKVNITISDASIIKINSGFTNPNTTNLSGNTLWITPSYNFMRNLQSGTKVRGIYYNPNVDSLSNTTHIAFESTSGNVVMKGLKTSNSTTDSIAIWINDTLSKAPYPSGGVGPSDTIYTQNPIMYTTRNDSNIIFFNADTANVWRSSGGGIDSLKRSSDSVFARKNGNFIFQFKDSVGTNPAPVGYYGSFIDTTTQSAIVINTAYPIRLGVTELSNGVSIASNSRITIANAGIYNLQFSLQLEKTGGSGNMTADIWLRKNGTNVPNSTGKVVLTGSANASPLVVSWNYLINSSSNEYYELMWSTSNLNVEIVKNPATSTHPLIPSVIATITQQSGIMSGTGISPLDTASMLSPYARTNVMNASLETKLNISDTASLSNRINTKQTDLDILQSIGFGIKAEPYGCSFANVTSQLALTTGMSFYPFNWNVSDTLRGVAFYNRATSVAVTPSNYNGVAIYSLSGSSLTRQTFTANSGTFWDNTANTWKTQAFTPFFLAKGTYYIGYQASASSGTPTIASGLAMQTGFIEPPVAINPNAIKLSCAIANLTTSPPVSVAMSSTSTAQRVPYFILY
jgi:hypothetical protein